VCNVSFWCGVLYAFFVCVESGVLCVVCGFVCCVRVFV